MLEVTRCKTQWFDESCHSPQLITARGSLRKYSWGWLEVNPAKYSRDNDLPSPAQQRRNLLALTNAMLVSRR
jgi:hypothetical protein